MRRVARVNRRNGGFIAIEWPTTCSYWHDVPVQDFIREIDLDRVRFKVCALGLTGKGGLPVAKPWTVASDCEPLLDALSPFQCPRNHWHVELVGKYAKRSERYTPKMATVIHRAWRDAVSQIAVARPMAVPGVQNA